MREFTAGCALWSLLGRAAGQGCVHNGVDFSPLNTVREARSSVSLPPLSCSPGQGEWGVIVMVAASQDSRPSVVTGRLLALDTADRYDRADWDERRRDRDQPVRAAHIVSGRGRRHALLPHPAGIAGNNFQLRCAALTKTPRSRRPCVLLAWVELTLLSECRLCSPVHDRSSRSPACCGYRADEWQPAALWPPADLDRVPLQ